MVRTPGMSKREPRIDVRKPVVVVNSNGAEIEAVILDISSNGFRLEIGDDDLRIGEFVSLEVDEGLVQAQIRWVLGKEAGGSFLEAVDFDSL